MCCQHHALHATNTIDTGSGYREQLLGPDVLGLVAHPHPHAPQALIRACLAMHAGHAPPPRCVLRLRRRQPSKRPFRCHVRVLLPGRARQPHEIP
eukprot:3206849-Rhodomonas_salina.1